ncbi:hypothetical protein SRHO_G00322490 [Serrasalmus rhombeus]
MQHILSQNSKPSTTEHLHQPRHGQRAEAALDAAQQAVCAASAVLCLRACVREQAERESSALGAFGVNGSGRRAAARELSSVLNTPSSYRAVPRIDGTSEQQLCGLLSSV